MNKDNFGSAVVTGTAASAWCWGLLVVAGLARAQDWLPPAPTGVEVTETYGIQFSTIGDPGNEPCLSYERVPPEFEDPLERSRYWRPFGQVDTVYRIARSEVTTEQWLEFLNAFAGTREREWFTQPENYDYWFIGMGPQGWGAFRRRNPDGPGYQWYQYDLPWAGRVPVIEISLKSAMMYCNWLHNGRQQGNWNSLVDGVYDVSQLFPVGSPFQRPLHRRIGAKFWIPSADEWVKSAHYDPNTDGNGHGGYWEYAARTNTPVVYAPPYEGGEANAGFRDFVSPEGEVFDADFMPLSSYPATQSAYGLLDVIGCLGEFTDTLLQDYPQDWNSFWVEVVIEGSNASYLARWGVNAEPLRQDRLGYFQQDTSRKAGLRIAASMPVRADWNGDGFVDFFDYDAFVGCFEGGECRAGRTADYNADGGADARDLIDFVLDFESGR